MLIETSAMRLVDRRLQPSTRAERIWTRFAVLSLFILTIILERLGIAQDQNARKLGI